MPGGCCYCWKRALQVAKVGPQQSCKGAESMWDLEPDESPGFSNQLCDLGSATEHFQPQSSPLCVIGVVIPAPLA